MKNIKNKIAVEIEEIETLLEAEVATRNPYFDNLLAEQQRRALLPEDLERVQAAQEVISE